MHRLSKKTPRETLSSASGTSGAASTGCGIAVGRRVRRRLRSLCSQLSSRSALLFLSTSLGLWQIRLVFYPMVLDTAGSIICSPMVRPGGAGRSGLDFPHAAGPLAGNRRTARVRRQSGAHSPGMRRQPCAAPAMPPSGPRRPTAQPHARLAARPRRGAAATCTASNAADPDHRHPAVRCPQRLRPVCVAAPCVHFGTTGGMDPDRTSAAKPSRASISACQRCRSSPHAPQHGPQTDAPRRAASSWSAEPSTYPSAQTCRMDAPRGG